MGNKIEKAVTNFANGFNCAQSVFSAYNQEFNIKDKEALRLTSGLFGGLCLQDKSCGAVLGAMLVLGLKYGNSDASDQDAKENVKTAETLFIEKFKKAHGDIDCTPLLKLNLSKPDDLTKNREEGRSKTICPAFIEGAIRIIEEIENELK